MNDSSILVTIKKMLGISPDYDAFDTEIVSFINSSIYALSQMGIGDSGYLISGEEATWDDYLGDGFTAYSDVVSYIYYRVRLAFDPPSSSTAVESFKELMKEAEWRLNAEYETPFEGMKRGEDANGVR